MKNTPEDVVAEVIVAEAVVAEAEVTIEPPDKTQAEVSVKEEKLSSLLKMNSPLSEHSPRNCDMTFLKV